MAIRTATAGSRLTAAFLNDIQPMPTAASPLDTTERSTSSGSYVELGGNDGGCTFVAPYTGVVSVTFSAELRLTSGSNFTLSSVEVREGGTIGSGTVVLAASDNRVLRHESTVIATHSRTFPLTGLTYGSTYNIRFMHRCNGVTLAMINRQILVHSA